MGRNKQLRRATPVIGRVRKNSGGKRQAYFQPQVSTGIHQADRLLITGYFCLSPLTSGFFTGATPEWSDSGASGGSDWCHTCNHLTGSRPAFFPPLVFTLSLFLRLTGNMEIPRQGPQDKPYYRTCLLADPL